MDALLEAVAEGWGWKLGKPVAIVATNRFGNAIVENQQGHYYRIMPEEWDCELLASCAAELEEKRKSKDFIRDWEMASLVARAEVSQGSLPAGRVYYLVVPGVIGGKYSEENIRTISLRELLSYSGIMARQIDGLPDGTNVEIVVKK